MMFRNAARFACVLAVAAILVRAVIPAGFMPDITKKSFSMVICTLDGGRTVDVPGNFDPAPTKPAKSGVCDFALALQDTLVADAPNILYGGLVPGVLTLAYFYALAGRRVPRMAQACPRAPPHIR
jgi:hypothetical protein